MAGRHGPAPIFFFLSRLQPYLDNTHVHHFQHNLALLSRKEEKPRPNTTDETRIQDLRLFHCELSKVAWLPLIQTPLWLWNNPSVTIRFMRPSDGRQLTNARRVSKVLSFVPVAWHFPSFSSTSLKLMRCALMLVSVEDREELGGPLYEPESAWPLVVVPEWIEVSGM